jgi:hypothetical protein
MGEISSQLEMKSGSSTNISHLFPTLCPEKKKVLTENKPT